MNFLKLRLLGWTMTWIGIGCLWLGVIGFTNKSFAMTPGVSVLYCADIDRQLDLNQAKDCPYVPYEQLRLPTQQGGITWVRLTINSIHADSPIGLFVSPHLIERIDIFDGQTNQLIAGPVGTSHRYSEAHGLVGGYWFVLNGHDPSVRYYFIRLATRGLAYAIVEALPLDQASGLNMTQRLGLGLHLGVLGLLFLASTMGWLVTRDRITGCFALVILNLLLATLAGSGILFQYFWPDRPELNEPFFNAMFYLRAAFWVMLAQAFLSAYQPPRWYRPTCVIAYLSVGVMLLLSWTGYSSISNWLLLIFGVTLIPIFQIVAIHKTQDIRNFYRHILVAGYVLGALLVWATLLITVFPTSDSRLPIQFARLVDYVNPLILLALVVFHYRETASQLAVIRKENLAIRLGLELEHKLRDERKLMVDMLTHELKNPLASISLAIGSLTRVFKAEDGPVMRRLQNIEQSVHSMDSVIERCNIMNQLDQHSLVCIHQAIDLNEVFNDMIGRFPDGYRVHLSMDAPSAFATDPQFFQMIMVNLIENALKYSLPESDVTVSVTQSISEAKPHLLIDVINLIGTKGYPDKRMVFTRFYRNPLALQTAGSGIGLYLVHALVRLLRGQIEFKASATHVTFRVVLPKAQEHG